MDGPSFSYLERREGGTELVHTRQRRAQQLADATTPYESGDFERVLHYHPVTISGLTAEHIEKTAALKAENDRRRRALGIEHEITMSQITSTSERMPNEHARRRELHLSAIDDTPHRESQQYLEAVHRAEDHMTSRQQMALGEIEKGAVDISQQAGEKHLKKLKAIETEHRLKLMQLDEEKIQLDEEQVSTAIKDEHDFLMLNMQQKHDRKMELLKAQHAGKLATIKGHLPTRDKTAEADADAVPVLFGASTAELLWQLGMSEEYAEKHNLAKKLETALVCISAEQPEDPGARLAQLLR